MSWFEEYIQRQGQMFMLRLVVGAVFGIFCLYVFSAFSGCTEISYSLYGQKINATVIKAAFDENKQVYRVTYRFNVAGMKKSYKKTMSVARDQRIEPSEHKIPVIYMPSDPEISTLVARRSLFGLYLFISMNIIVAIVVGMAVIWARRVSSKSR